MSYISSHVIRTTSPSRQQCSLIIFRWQLPRSLVVFLVGHKIFAFIQESLIIFLRVLVHSLLLFLVFLLSQEENWLWQYLLLSVVCCSYSPIRLLTIRLCVHFWSRILRGRLLHDSELLDWFNLLILLSSINDVHWRVLLATWWRRSLLLS